MNEFDETEEYENLEEEFGGPSKKAKITKKVLRILGWVLFATVMIIFAYRTCANSNDPKYISTMLVNDKLAALYNEEGKDMQVIWQKNDPFSREKETYGYFAATQAIYIPKVNQFQVVIRYNQSTLEYLKEDLEKDYPALAPQGDFDRNAELFDISLVKVIDLTPDNKDDNNVKENLKTERYKFSDFAKEERGLHSFRRYSFENIDVTDALALYIDIYYSELVDYEKDPYATIVVYSKEKHDRPYKLSKSDKKALNAAINAN